MSWVTLFITLYLVVIWFAFSGSKRKGAPVYVEVKKRPQK